MLWNVNTVNNPTTNQPSFWIEIQLEKRNLIEIWYNPINDDDKRAKVNCLCPSFPSEIPSTFKNNFRLQPLTKFDFDCGI